MNDNRQLSSRIVSENYLRSIIDHVPGEGETGYSTAEKISAIKELRILTGGDESAPTSGPGSLTRDAIHAELHRLRALTGG